MTDSEYDAKWERRRRVQRVTLIVVAVCAALGVVAPMASTLL